MRGRRHAVRTAISASTCGPSIPCGTPTGTVPHVVSPHAVQVVVVRFGLDLGDVDHLMPQCVRIAAAPAEAVRRIEELAGQTDS
jgi:hypothetical protein